MTDARTPELADIIQQAIEDRLAEVHVMLPGRIKSYDAGTQKAEVEPMLTRLQKTVDGEIKETLPVIPDVPVVFPRAGGFKITMPVQAGDRCMLVFCERSIDKYQIGDGGVTDPDLFQMHDLSDPVAVLGWYTDKEALDTTDDTYMVMGKDGGGASIHIGDDEVTIYESEGSEALIHIANNQVNLYEKSASEFVALADKTKTELDKLKDDINNLKTVLSAWVPVPQDGGAALKAAAGVWYGTPVTIAPVNAQKVKAT